MAFCSQTKINLRAATFKNKLPPACPKGKSNLRPVRQQRVRDAKNLLEPVAALGGDQDDKKFISREEEPDNFWQTPTEAKGENPAKDPIAIIGVLGLLLPFVILGIAIATGLVDVSAGKP